jgi:hypothetical protein
MRPAELNAAWSLIADDADATVSEIVSGSRTVSMRRLDYKTGETTAAQLDEVALLPVPLTPEEAISITTELSTDTRVLRKYGYSGNEPEALKEQVFPALRAYLVIVLQRFGYDSVMRPRVTMPSYAESAARTLAAYDDAIASILLLREDDDRSAEGNEELLDLLEDIDDLRWDVEEASIESLSKLLELNSN